MSGPPHHPLHYPCFLVLQAHPFKVYNNPVVTLTHPQSPPPHPPLPPVRRCLPPTGMPRARVDGEEGGGGGDVGDTLLVVKGWVSLIDILLCGVAMGPSHLPP